MTDFKINKSLSLACEELDRIADSLKNDKKIKVTAKGVNALNRELESNINLKEIRKLKFDDFKDGFGNKIPASNVACTLRGLANTIRSGQTLYEHIGGLADAERALKIKLTSHLMSKSDFIRYMKKKNLTFKRGYSAEDYNVIFRGKREQYEKHFYFPFTYREMTKAELERQERQKRERRKKAGKKAVLTKKRNAQKEQDRKRVVNKKIAEMTNIVNEYIRNTSNDIPLFLDTETTGLNHKDEVIEIAIVDIDENVIIDTLIHTKKRISEDARFIHGIWQTDIEQEPKFREIEDLINKLVSGREVWIYNAGFDIDKMETSASKNWSFNAKNIHCLMQESMRHFTGGYYRISLENACHRVGLIGGGHRAKADALASARLYKKLSEISD